MSVFTDELVTRWYPQEGEWGVEVPFEFHSVKKDSGLFSGIEKGFKSDLASIPWIIRPLIPKVGKDAQGAIVHDKGYQTGELTARFIDASGNEHIKNVPVTRGMVDAMYYEAMLLLEVNCLRREAIRLGLAVGGWYTWKKYRKMDQAKRPGHHFWA